MARDVTVVKNGSDWAFYVDGQLQGACWTEPRLEVLTKYLGVEVLDLTSQELGGQIDFIREAPTLELLKARMKSLRKEKRERRIALLQQQLAELKQRAAEEEEAEEQTETLVSDK